MLDNPIASTALVSLVAGLVLAAVARLTRAPWVAGFALPLVFVASYLRTYGGVPDFPPVAASGKVIYIAVIGGAIGLVLDAAEGSTALRRIVLAIAPLPAAAWIALPRILALDTGTIAGALALWIVGAAILLHLDSVNNDERNGGGLVATATLLGLALAAGLGGTGLIDLAAPRQSFTAGASLGAALGLFAMADTVTLISREEDIVALVLVLLVPAFGAAAARLLPAAWPTRPVLRRILIGVAACVPVLIVVATLLARHDDPFPS
jgi:hypothetical protein